jgi:hypothetical protein
VVNFKINRMGGCQKWSLAYELSMRLVEMDEIDAEPLISVEQK